MFVDEITVELHAGHGGSGITAFRRESHVPKGGPSGGDGGRGGSVVFVAKAGMTTLHKLRFRRILKAKSGKNGGPDRKHGAGGGDLIAEVPPGTLCYDMETGELLGDLIEPGQRLVGAKGGDGGRGNARFATPTNRAPRRHEQGWPGESRSVRLELKLLADVGLLGYPSVGKSTLIGRISNARPRVADYPFTTLVPNLGVVAYRNYGEIVVADIPGLIEGASEGKGLGHQFLRHVERTRILAHLIEVVPQLEEVPEDRDPIRDFERLNRELERFDPEVAKRPQIAVLNKIDLPFVAEREAELRAYFKERDIPFLAISAVAGRGLEQLVDRLGEAVEKAKAADG